MMSWCTQIPLNEEHLCLVLLRSNTTPLWRYFNDQIPTSNPRPNSMKICSFVINSHSSTTIGKHLTFGSQILVRPVMSVSISNRLSLICQLHLKDHFIFLQDFLLFLLNLQQILLVLLNGYVLIANVHVYSCAFAHLSSRIWYIKPMVYILLFF